MPNMIAGAVLAVSLATLVYGHAGAADACYPNLPKPRIDVVGSEDYSTPSGQWTRFLIEVKNSSSFPAELFAAAPDLPPCGLNRESSRTWVDILDADGNAIYGFCALESPDQLNDMWFAITFGSTPPQKISIRLRDRRCGLTYESNATKVPAVSTRDRSVALVRVATTLGPSSIPGAEGHSWIEVKELASWSSPPDTWGTWGNKSPQGLYPNLERNFSAATSRSKFITQRQYDRLKSVLATYKAKGEKAWSLPRTTCAEFAKDAWKSVSSETIDTRAGTIFALPVAVYSWTLEANEFLWHRTTNTCNSVYCTSSCPSPATVCR